MSKFSVVATPIGNLEDMTLRALRTLKEADCIVCEDTRVTSKLLAHFDIAKPLTSFRGAPDDFERVLKMAEEGKHIAFLSDAGTPGISDPGLELISRVREQVDDVEIEAIPGPSALTAAISISGLRAATFVFYGFLPLKKGREKLLQEAAASERASVLYESPHRIMKTLQSLSQLITDRRIGVFRELTKVHEESVVGKPQDVLQYFIDHEDKQRGEFVLIIESER